MICVPSSTVGKQNDGTVISSLISIWFEDDGGKILSKLFERKYFEPDGPLKTSAEESISN